MPKCRSPPFFAWKIVSQEKWSDKICSVMLEYLLSDEEKRFNTIIAIFRKWVKSKEGAHLDIARCNRTCTRFTTDRMTAIFPDIPNASSG